LKRTLQTAQYIADVKNLPIIRTDKLKEINGGTGKTENGKNCPNCGRKNTTAGRTDLMNIKCPAGSPWLNFRKG